MAGGFRWGVDEAGYGPRLGPLVVGLVHVWSPGPGLWEAVDGALGELPEIRDSKEVLRGGRGFRELETIALAAFSCARGRQPRSLKTLLAEEPAGLSDHPWYGALDLPLPRRATRREVARATVVLEESLTRVGARLHEVVARPMLEGELNRRVGSGLNKAEIELGMIEGLLLSRLKDGARGVILCDRLGGRKHYGDWLSCLFPFWKLEVEEESPRTSAYGVTRGSEDIRARFLVEGECREGEIALASCVAKYVRELMMEAFNAFWTHRHEGLLPTAGYPSDAKRWLSDVEHDQVFARHRSVLVRER